MPDISTKPFDDVRECGIWQENGSCRDCLVKKEGKCLHTHYSDQKTVMTVKDSNGKMIHEFTTFRSDFAEKIIEALPIYLGIEDIREKRHSLTITMKKNEDEAL